MPSLVIPQNRELSWLSFNERVLQEAADKTVRPVSRMHFLGIVSSNLDDFYRVRMGSLNQALKNLARNKGKEKEKIHELLDAVRLRTLNLQDQVVEILTDIRGTLEQQHNITLIDQGKLNAAQKRWAREHFSGTIRPGLSIVTNCTSANLRRFIRSDGIYLAVRLQRQSNSKKIHPAIIEIPNDTLPRFIAMPQELCEPDKYMFVWLDDVIRIGLADVFEQFGYSSFEAYTMKLSRNAEMTIDNDIVANYIDRLSSKLRLRAQGEFVRFTYDAQMPDDLFRLLLRRLSMAKGATIISGGRYHSLRDLISFPAPPEVKGLLTKPHAVIKIESLDPSKRYMPVLEKKDILLHYPYHSFYHVVHLLREASLDPEVTALSMTIYRVAPTSEIMDSLISALHNGKRVMVFMELKARFDEAANIAWVRRLEDAGAMVLTSINNYKVHSKLIYIERAKGANLAVISTGNFNENSARFYSDMALMTADKAITNEVKRLFEFLRDPTLVVRFKELLVAPRFMRKRLGGLIENEIKAAKKGEPAYIRIKMNNLVDSKIVKLLEKAASAGVKVDIVVRSTCAINPEKPEYGGRMRIVSLVDNLLEHARVLIFANRGDPLVYISSADIMKRNLDHRVEVAAPVKSAKLRKQIIHIFNLHLNDNCKARIINANQDNPYQHLPGDKVRAQTATWQYLKELG